MWSEVGLGLGDEMKNLENTNSPVTTNSQNISDSMLIGKEN